MEVSVIIPTFNSAQFLTAAVDSVLAQTFKDFEIIVVDDGSVDNTEEVLKKYGDSIRYIKQKNQGVSIARNNGINLSNAKYVSFLDADDTWLPLKLERQMKALASQPEYRLCFTNFIPVDADMKPFDKFRLYPQGTALEDLLLRGNLIGSICTVVCERTLFDEIGGFDPEFSQCADWDMWVRLATKTEFLFVDEKLVTYRHHNTNMSRNARLLEDDSTRVLEKGFAMTDTPIELKKKRKESLARNYMVLAGSYYRAGQKKDFLRCAMRSVTLNFKEMGYLLRFPIRARRK